MTQPEGQTARDISFEDDGVPDLQDGTPEQQWAEDPEFLPLPGERPTATVDFGTTAVEQAEGESLTGRLDRELPDVGADMDAPAAPGRVDIDVDAAGDPLQLHQDGPGDLDESGTERTGDDVLAVEEEPVGGQGPEEAAMHITDG